jgi:hypothetical protein
MTVKRDNLIFLATFIGLHQIAASSIGFYNWWTILANGPLGLLVVFVGPVLSLAISITVYLSTKKVDILPFAFMFAGFSILLSVFYFMIEYNSITNSLYRGTIQMRVWLFELIMGSNRNAGGIAITQDNKLTSEGFLVYFVYHILHAVSTFLSGILSRLSR